MQIPSVLFYSKLSVVLLQTRWCEKVLDTNIRFSGPNHNILFSKHRFKIHCLFLPQRKTNYTISYNIPLNDTTPSLFWPLTWIDGSSLWLWGYDIHHSDDSDACRRVFYSSNIRLTNFTLLLGQKYQPFNTQNLVKSNQEVRTLGVRSCGLFIGLAHHTACKTDNVSTKRPKGPTEWWGTSGNIPHIFCFSPSIHSQFEERSRVQVAGPSCRPHLDICCGR